MSLIQCKECGASISQKASACPMCGAKRGVGACGCIAVILGVSGVMFLGALTFCGNAVIKASKNAPPAGDSLLENSKWDSSVFYVKQHLKAQLKDPDSYEGIDWSPVQKLPDGTFTVRHKYRAKNSFGGYVIENKVFTYNSQGVVIRVVSF